MKWQQTVLKLGDAFRRIEKEVRMEVMEQVWTAAFTGLYLHYDMAADFMPQFEANAEKFSALVDLVLWEGGFKPEV